MMRAFVHFMCMFMHVQIHVAKKKKDFWWVWELLLNLFSLI